MKQNVRIFRRFQGYTVQDCACVYCRFYAGKRRGCWLEACCFLEEKLCAAQRAVLSPNEGGKNHEQIHFIR